MPCDTRQPSALVSETQIWSRCEDRVSFISKCSRYQASREKGQSPGAKLVSPFPPQHSRLSGQPPPPRERQAKMAGMVSRSLLLRSNEGKMQRLGAGFPRDLGFHFIKDKVLYSSG